MIPALTELRTERLLLRPLRATDASMVHRLVNDWEVAKQLARVPFPYPFEVAEDWIASSAAQMVAGRAWNLAITREAPGGEVLLGCVAVRRGASDAREAELGYWIGRRHWGQGYAAEAATRLAGWALAHLEIDRILADALLDNPASHAVLRRIGFRPAGEGRREFLSRGGPMPVLLFAAGRGDVVGSAAAAPAPVVPAVPGLPLLLVAAVALIDTDGRVLLARRPEGKPLAGLWEFPGGKLLPGETAEAALIRELREELGIDVAASCLAPFTFASHAYEQFHLLMPLYLCRRWEGTPTGREGQALAWVRPAHLRDYAMPPADRPLVAMLRDAL